MPSKRPIRPPCTTCSREANEFTTAMSAPPPRTPPDRPPAPAPPDIITAADVAAGMDMQGIPWPSLPVSREEYREERLRDNRMPDRPEVPDASVPAGHFYDFKRNVRKVKCAIAHFQLRNLVRATSRNDVFVVDGSGVLHWDVETDVVTRWLELTDVRVASMCADGERVYVGGFNGELGVGKEGKAIYLESITQDEAIVNAVEMVEGGVMTCGNDGWVRTYDKETFAPREKFDLEKPVNHATREGKLVVAGLDERVVKVVEAEGGGKVADLVGHTHFCFATAWKGNLIATGAQDRTCRVWDVRKMDEAVFVGVGRVGAIRSVQWGGERLIAAEPRDFVSVWGEGFGERQEIDFFGEVGGVGVSPGGERVFVAVCDRNYSSVMQFEVGGGE